MVTLITDVTQVTLGESTVQRPSLPATMERNGIADRYSAPGYVPVLNSSVG